MAINFPNNRDQLDPPQPSGPLQDGDAFTDAGQTWTWNSGLGVWSTEAGGGADLDALYLSKINDDVANGAITFEGQTTHEAGVSITGGTAADVGTGMMNGGSLVRDSLERFRPGSTIQSFQVKIPSNPLPTTGDIREIEIIPRDTGHTGQTYDGIYVSAGSENTGASEFSLVRAIASGNNINGNVYGFKSDVNSSASATNAYNFYAAGSAPSYFSGGVQFDDTAGASVLDKYEVGTWTPRLGQSGGDDAVLDYDVQDGKYIRIGRIVHVFFHIKVATITSTPGATVTLAIKGLPFSGTNAGAPSGTNARSGVSITSLLNWNMESSNSPAIIGGRVLTSTAIGLSYVNNTTGNWMSCKHRQIANDCVLIGSATYETNNA